MAIRAIKTLKSWFERGKYPTANQFGDWLDSYFHKEEKIPMQSVDGLTEIINKKYNQSDGEALKEQADKTVKDLAAHEAKNVDDFKSVHESIQNLEEEDEKLNTAINNVYTKEEVDTKTTTITSNIDKIANMLKGGATLDQAKAALIALGSNYQDLFSVSNTLKTFLTASDLSDSTINSWKEIEIFLAGITDTQSLTSLLTDLKAEITTEYTQLLNGKAPSVHGHSATEITEVLNKRFMTDAERAKLAGIIAGANKYTHPSTHTASMIVETVLRRFVSDTQIANWNKKASATTEIAETTTTKQIRPNTFHVWGSISSLSITLASETANRYNEYMFQFTSGATATTLTLPSSVILPEGFSIKANKTYQISIVNNLLIWGEW